jgi:predicted O-methyltransferase YrrM
MSLRTFLKFTHFGRVMAMPYRLFAVALPVTLKPVTLAFRWTFSSKEHYNHTYHLTELNQRYLDAYVAVVSGHELASIERYSRELNRDDELRRVLIQQTRASRERNNCDEEPRYGRRIGWYALVRATKPKIVVETGVDRGLGTAVIAAALKRNSEEGFPGLVYATDIVPTCGHLLVEPYKAHCRLLIGDSVESLKGFKQPVDIFLHDSDHRPEYEWAEFLAIESRLHPGSLVLSDNSQQTSKLLEFSERTGKSFLYFQDAPKDHWWPGDGIGSAFVPGVRSMFSSASDTTSSRIQ